MKNRKQYEEIRKEEKVQREERKTAKNTKKKRQKHGDQVLSSFTTVSSSTVFMF